MTDRCRHGGVVLIMVIACIALLAFLVTGFIARMKQDSLISEDTLRLSRNRLLLQAAMHYIQESSRLGYAILASDGTTSSPREAFGWVDTRVNVPESTAFTAANYNGLGTGSGVKENWESRRIGPRDANGYILWPYIKEKYNPDTSPVSFITVTDGGMYKETPIVKIETTESATIGFVSATAAAIVAFSDTAPFQGPIVGITVINGGNGYINSDKTTVKFYPPPKRGPVGSGATVCPEWEVSKCRATVELYKARAVPTTNPIWPAPGSVMRAPFYRMKRPPFAVAMTVAPNAIPNDPSLPTFGIPFLNKADPRPQFDSNDVNRYDPVAPNMSLSSISRGPTVMGKVWADGDTTAIDDSLNLGWFRIYREDGTEPDRVSQGGDQVFGLTGATFIITVGSGGTLGFRDWSEVLAEHQEATFGTESVFTELQARERRQWYRVEWSATVGGGEDHIYAFALGAGDSPPQYSWFEQLPLNCSRFIENGSMDQFSGSQPRNYIGTIRYIQRLPSPPTDRATTPVRRTSW